MKNIFHSSLLSMVTLLSFNLIAGYDTDDVAYSDNSEIIDNKIEPASLDLNQENADLFLDGLKDFAKSALEKAGNLAGKMKSSIQNLAEEAGICRSGAQVVVDKTKDALLKFAGFIKVQTGNQDPTEQEIKDWTNKYKEKAKELLSQIPGLCK